jgi:hypothetical protein
MRMGGKQPILGWPLFLVGGDPVDERVLLPGPADLLPHLSAERLPRRQLEQEAGGIQHLQARLRETNTPVRKRVVVLETVLWIRKNFSVADPDPGSGAF